MKELTLERKRQLNADLWIIFLASMIVLGLVSTFQQPLYAFVGDKSKNIVLRVLTVGGLGQFGVAGLGITIVCLLRKESFASFGLTKKNLAPALFFSLLCCVPSFIYNYATGNVHAWCPFSDVNTTKEVLSSSLPYSIIGMIITAVFWGFFEGFNYVVICDKINELNQTKNKWIDFGALVCAIMCIIVHGAVGVTPNAIIDMVVTMILIYGMLVVKRKTGNAWGCILIFFVFWNAI